jgi:gluconate 5-dehydrogenase
MSIRQLFDLAGKTALVTGGSRGLGLQMAQALGEMGARVAISARKADELAEARVHLVDAGIEAITITNDLSDFDGIPGLVDQALAGLGGIDILINNAGTTWGAPMEDYPIEAWNKVMDLNINGLFLLTQEVGKRAMLPKRYGKILNIASLAGLGGNPPEFGTKMIAYNASKAAVVNFTRTLAGEWGPYNINVNVLCPGFFPTKIANAEIARVHDLAIARTPLQRFGGEDDIKGAAIFFVSEASRHITGQALAIDGGFSAGF